MPQVARPVVKERARRLRESGAATLARFLEGQSGAETEVLVERPGIGRTPQFAEIEVEPALDVGVLARTRIAGHDGNRLVGEVAA
jgi:threonylcarbamoyladenosine tRNA methylthiotransferase MtaB